MNKIKGEQWGVVWKFWKKNECMQISIMRYVKKMGMMENGALLFKLEV